MVQRMIPACSWCRRTSRPRSRSPPTVPLALLLLTALAAASPSSAFTVARPGVRHRASHRASPHARHPPAAASSTSSLSSTALSASLPPTQLPDMPDLPSILTSVDTFDGSTIVDPVVVSGAFWAGLKGKIISVVIGQILAAVAFAAVSSAVASQLPKLGEFVGGLFFKDADRVKANVSQFATSSSAAASSDATRSVNPDVGKLLLCLAIDAIGTSSELVPVLGEITDIGWAPVAALALRSLYGGSNVVFALEFAEEILPFTDVLPLATLCWFVETFAGDGDLAKALGIGRYGRGMQGGTVVDVPAQEQGREQGRSDGNERPRRK